MNSIRKNSEDLTFSRVNITNLVDVALTLVIILLIISPFLEQGIEVKLPTSSPGRVQVENSTIITIAPGDVYYIDDRKVTLREMYNILREKKRINENLSVVIKGDESVLYKNVVKVLDISKKCNIETIGLATQAEMEQVR
ncbi:MAG: biopolymer transporter ExbD [Candidatus Omnitrophica bacterium]|nr:biopolymer transporter ExbD [Candidatus Omnitrophota bacterium]MCM8776665.1 biopolymer transporter ExbD [Candidatus Omnitrophota bacterium]